MAKWKHKVEIRHLMTDNSDPKNVKKSMNAIADVLEKDTHFKDFFENLDAGVEEFRLCDNLSEANNLLDDFWNYCDEHRIWVPF